MQLVTIDGTSKHRQLTMFIWQFNQAYFEYQSCIFSPPPGFELGSPDPEPDDSYKVFT